MADVTGQPGPRIHLVGCAGAGKTTFGRELAGRLGVPFVELDELHWGPDWTERPWDDLIKRVTELVAQPTWVIDGNYDVVRDIIGRRASAIVWLDYSRLVVHGRVIRRTIRRVLTGEPTWHGNRETLRHALFSRDSIIWWSVKTYGLRRREYAPMLASRVAAGMEAVHLKSPRAAARWLAAQGRTVPAE